MKTLLGLAFASVLAACCHAQQVAPFQTVAAMEELRISNPLQWEEGGPSCCYLCNGSFCIWSCTVGSCACGGHICTEAKPNRNPGLVEKLIHPIDLDSLPTPTVAASNPDDGLRCCYFCQGTFCFETCVSSLCTLARPKLPGDQGGGLFDRFN